MQAQLDLIAGQLAMLTTQRTPAEFKVSGEGRGSVPTVVGQQVVAHTVNQTFVQQPTINVNAWDGGERLVVSLELLRDAFRECEALREFCALPDQNRRDPEFISAYVLEALVALVRRAHASPECRNVRLNPARADQVQVLVRGDGAERWELITLVEAVRLLFGDAAGRMERLAWSPQAFSVLSAAEQEASAAFPLEYRRRPEHYQKEGKQRLAAHFANLGARAALSGGSAASGEAKMTESSRPSVAPGAGIAMPGAAGVAAVGRGPP